MARWEHREVRVTTIEGTGEPSLWGVDEGKTEAAGMLPARLPRTTPIAAHDGRTVRIFLYSKRPLTAQATQWPATEETPWSLAPAD